MRRASARAPATGTRLAPWLGHQVMRSEKANEKATNTSTSLHGMLKGTSAPSVNVFDVSRLRARTAPPTTPEPIPITAMKLDSMRKASVTVAR